MISVLEAIQITNNNSIRGNVVELPLNEAQNLFLAEDIVAPINVPSFNQSAMDGYAFNYRDMHDELEIVDEIPAGDTRTVGINQGEAVRIFTGAMVPIGCDTVVMQELTEVNENRLKVKDEGLKLGGNIRSEGHQIQSGALALQKGTKITPAAIGFLTSLGITQVKVCKLPKVSLLVTGDELVKPGNELTKGEIYESNTLMLRGALNEFGIEPRIESLPDDFDRTKAAIEVALTHSDIVLLSGGISVGDYDYVRPALLENRVEELFYKVKQKPGKPLFFGRKKDKLIFALPGNPAAALNCFYVYVYSIINHFIGCPNPALKNGTAVLQNEYKKKSGRAEFLKAVVKGNEVTFLDGQGSDVLLSFANANCLVYLPNEKEQIAHGETVEIYHLPV